MRLRARLLALMLIVAFTLGSAAQALAEAEDEVEEVDEEEPEVETWLEVDEDGFRYEFTFEHGERAESVQIEFDAESATLDVEHEDESRAGSRETALRVEVRQLIEYRDIDGDDRFTSLDEAIQRHRVSALPVRMLQNVRPDVDVTAQYALPHGGVLALDFRANGASAAAMKFDIRIERYPFAEDGTRLALETRMWSSTEVDLEDDEQGISTADAHGGAYYRWVEHADVDGTPRPVAVTIVQSKGTDASEHVVTFNYAAGTHILHDPEVGFEPFTSAITDAVKRIVRGDARTYAVGIALATTLVALTITLKLRGGRQL